MSDQDREELLRRLEAVRDGRSCGDCINCRLGDALTKAVREQGPGFVEDVVRMAALMRPVLLGAMVELGHEKLAEDIAQQWAGLLVTGGPEGEILREQLLRLRSVLAMAEIAMKAMRAERDDLKRELAARG